MIFKRTTANFLSILTSIALAVGMVPAMALCAYADDPETATAASEQIEQLDVTDQSEEPEADGVAESFRFDGGSPIENAEEVIENMRSDAAKEEGALQGFAMTDDGAGHKMFDWFDKFDQGYYTDTDANRGVDVSNWQRDIDWAQVKGAGINFAIIKCGESAKTGADNWYDFKNWYDDKYWVKNARGCLDNGIAFGAYFYAHATTVDGAIYEARHTLDLMARAGVTPDNMTFPIYYDMEDKDIVDLSREELKATADAFCRTIEAAGFKAGVYSSMSWWNGRLSLVDGWYKWVAAYNATIGLTYKGFSDFRNSDGIWQFSSLGQVAGIPGRVDMNYTYMNSTAPGEKIVEDGLYTVGTALSRLLSLDIAAASGANGANLQLYATNGTDAQKFRFEYKGGFYKITNVNSNKVLDVAGGSGRAGANVQQYASNDSNAQRWRIERNPDGTYTFISKASGHALDVSGAWAMNGANLQQYTPNGTAAQRFTLNSCNVEGAPYSIANGTYTIVSSVAPGKVVDVAGGSRDNCANIQLYSANGSDAQRFRFTYENGFYTITNVASGKALDVEGAFLHSGANVQQYDSNGTDAQKWRVDRNPDGSYTLVCKASGKVLDVSGGQTVDGTNICHWASNGSKAQQFILRLG